MRLLIAVAVPALFLGACASAPGNTVGYQAEMDRLAAQCDAQGGMLVPTGAAPTGNPAIEYACTLRGGASRLN